MKMTYILWNLQRECMQKKWHWPHQMKLMVILVCDDQKSLNEVKVVKQPRVKSLLQAIVGIKIASTVYRYS